MRVNTRRRQHERSRRSHSDSNGRFEIRQILVNYYIDTRGHRRRRLTFRDSLRAMSAMNVSAISAVSKATPTPSSSLSLASRPVNAPLQVGIGRDVNDEVSQAPNSGSLTFSSIAAASAPIDDTLLQVGCGSLATLDGDFADSSVCSNYVLMATPAPAFASAMIARGTISQTACSITESASYVTVVDTAAQGPKVESTSRAPRIVDPTIRCLRPTADCSERVYAFSTLPSGEAGVPDVTNVYGTYTHQAAEMVSRIVVASQDVANVAELAVPSGINAMADLGKVRSDAGETKLVLPIFPQLERWMKTSGRAEPEATLPQSPPTRTEDQSWMTEVHPNPKSRLAEAACGVLLASTLETRYRAPVRRALSLITARLGFRGSVSVIARSLTNEKVPRKPWRQHWDDTAPQLVFAGAAGAGTGDRDMASIIAILSHPLEEPIESMELAANWVSLTAA